MSEEEYARKNQRRAELIWKKNRQGLTPEELTEFTHLQELICEYLDARFPGPSEFLEQVEERARRLGDLP